MKSLILILITTANIMTFAQTTEDYLNKKNEELSYIKNFINGGGSYENFYPALKSIDLEKLTSELSNEDQEDWYVKQCLKKIEEVKNKLDESFGMERLLEETKDALTNGYMEEDVLKKRVDELVTICHKLLSFKDSEKTNSYLKKAQQINEKFNKTYNEKYEKNWTSEFHAHHIGEIFFVENVPLDLSLIEEKTFEAPIIFDGASPIYALFYYKEPIKEYTNGRGAIPFSVYEGENQYDGCIANTQTGYRVSAPELENSYLVIPIIPDKNIKIGDGQNTPRMIVKCLKEKLEFEDNLEINVSIFNQYEGSFKLNKTDKTIAYLDSVIESLEDKELGAVEMPKANTQNTEIEKMALSEVEKALQVTAKKANIVTSDWVIQYHPYSTQIVARYHEVYVAYQTKDNSCYYNNYVAIQNYLGDGKYGNTRIIGATISNNRQINCENID